MQANYKQKYLRQQQAKLGIANSFHSNLMECASTLESNPTIDDLKPSLLVLLSSLDNKE